jgi:hypothetical protein
MRRGRPLATLIFMSLGRVAAAAMLLVLSLAAAAQAHPLTTKPQLVLDIRVTITDTRIVLDRHSAPRGVEARFVIKNTGTKAHNFTLSGPKVPAGGRQGFSRTLKPGQHESVRLFLDVRTRETYFGGLPADRAKPGMRGLFVIR